MTVPRKGRLVFYKDNAKQWRWRFIAVNGRILADSGEGYGRFRDCEHGSKLVLYATPFHTEVRR